MRTRNGSILPLRFRQHPFSDFRANRSIRRQYRGQAWFVRRSTAGLVPRLNCDLEAPTALETPLIRIEKLSKVYRSRDSSLTIFHDLDLAVTAGDQVAVIGPSGAGKSTLLHLIAGLDSPTAGAIFYKDRNITRMPEAECSAFRNREIGYVWQQHHLLPEFTAVENVMMPLLIRGVSAAKARGEALACLEEVGLSRRDHHRAGELSGGEQQRIAIARALVSGPSLLLADEPTGNLDVRTGEMIFLLLADLRRRRCLTTILVTHNLQFAQECNRVLELADGFLHPARF
jgi:lipoprotein-releasing system ATP-binding protein